MYLRGETARGTRRETHLGIRLDRVGSDSQFPFVFLSQKIGVGERRRKELVAGADSQCKAHSRLLAVRVMCFFLEFVAVVVVASPDPIGSFIITVVIFISKSFSLPRYLFQR